MALFSMQIFLIIMAVSTIAEACPEINGQFNCEKFGAQLTVKTQVLEKGAKYNLKFKTNVRTQERNMMINPTTITQEGNIRVKLSCEGDKIIVTQKVDDLRAVGRMYLADGNFVIRGSQIRTYTYSSAGQRDEKEYVVVDESITCVSIN